LEKVVNLKPDHEVAHNILGLSYFGLKQYENAEKHLKETIKLKTDHAEAHVNLGRTYLITKQNDAAVDILQKAIKLNPAYAEAFYFLGVGYMVKEQKALAADQLYKAGLLYIKQDNPGWATTAYNELKRLDNKELEQKLYNMLHPEK
jgi:tetratricopeptide (TPR) repeat protein